MIDPLDKEINVDEIMEQIREELRKRGKLSVQEVPPSQEELTPIVPPSSPPPLVLHEMTESTSDKKKYIDQFLWKYGRKYKKIIKATPLLKKIAQKQHRRLVQQFYFSPPIPPSNSTPVNIDNLPYFINYHGFLEEAKKREGLKGVAKYHLFKLIRYFAWWQEQINRALYQEIVAQKARMEERERRDQELSHQQYKNFGEELVKRDQVIEEQNRKLTYLDQAKDALLQRLTEQRMEMEKMEQAKDRLSKDLDLHKTKIDEMNERVDSVYHQLMDRVKKEAVERDQWIEIINQRLVQFDRSQEELNQKMAFQKEKLDEVMRETRNILNQGISNLKIEYKDVHNKLKEKVESILHQLSSLSAIQSGVEQIAEEMKKHQLEILEQKRKLSIFLEENRLPDELYVNFENRFRGTREEIKERLRVYLPYVRQLQSREVDVSVLDLGCGRGEWLELMKENGFIGRGVDINWVMVKQCQELGLEVIELDMIDYLRNQESNSISVITGFHILEHLPIKNLLLLLEEIFRILKPGGIAIFETPNPENLLVATSNFFLDPTHLHPLPSKLLSFLMEAKGFKIIKIGEHRSDSFKEESQKALIALEFLQSLMDKGRDYSIVAQKEG